jgi:IS1 family transposase
MKPTASVSPSEIVKAVLISVTGHPNAQRISASYVERQNLTVRRMQLRRFTRLANGFSKKLENMKAVLALHIA